jgi:hypothetical protein
MVNVLMYRLSQWFDTFTVTAMLFDGLTFGADQYHRLDLQR